MICIAMKSTGGMYVNVPQRDSVLQTLVDEANRCYGYCLRLAALPWLKTSGDTIGFAVLLRTPSPQ